MDSVIKEEITMTLDEYFKEKEDLEISLLNFMNQKIQEFEKSTQIPVKSIQVVVFSDNVNRQPVVSDVHVLTNL